MNLLCKKCDVPVLWSIFPMSTAYGYGDELNRVSEKMIGFYQSGEEL